MKPKKSKKANLERKRTIFLQIGMILTLSAILFAFEWKTGQVNVKPLDDPRTEWIDTQVLPPVTRPEPEIKEVKPPSFEIDIVDDSKQLDVEDDLLDLFRELEEYQPEDFSGIIKEDEVVNDEPFIVAEFMPKFQGKDIGSFRNYILRNLTFPQSAIESGITGTVYIEFIVEKDGSVSDITIVRGVHPVVDKAVVEVISKSPKWEPGINNGKYVRVKFTIPVAFKLM